MRLSDYLLEDLILHGLDVGEGPGALAAFGNRLEEKGYLPSGKEVTRALLAREESHTTCLGHGVAVPHATVQGILKPLLLVATTQAPIFFGSEDSDPVDLFFVLLSPPGKGGEHIKLLARICRLSQHQDYLDEIRGAPDGPSMMEIILQLDSRHV